MSVIYSDPIPVEVSVSSSNVSGLVSVEVSESDISSSISDSVPVGVSVSSSSIILSDFVVVMVSDSSSSASDPVLVEVSVSLASVSVSSQDKEGGGEGWNPCSACCINSMHSNYWDKWCSFLHLLDPE